MSGLKDEKSRNEAAAPRMPCPEHSYRTAGETHPRPSSVEGARKDRRQPTRRYDTSAARASSPTRVKVCPRSGLHQPRLRSRALPSSCCAYRRASAPVWGLGIPHRLPSFSQMVAGLGGSASQRGTPPQPVSGRTLAPFARERDYHAARSVPGRSCMSNTASVVSAMARIRPISSRGRVPSNSLARMAKPCQSPDVC